MKINFRLGLAAGLSFGLAGAALAAGLYTNGLPGLTPGSRYSNLTSRALLAVDTGLPNGQNPQSVGVEAFRIGALASELIANQGTSTAGAATLNTLGGLVTTEALTTAVGATYTFTLSDSLIQAPGPGVPQVMVMIHSKSNTGGQSSGGAQGVQTTSVVQTAGQVVVTFTNNGTSALNGTMLIGFHI